VPYFKVPGKFQRLRYFISIKLILSLGSGRPSWDLRTLKLIGHILEVVRKIARARMSFISIPSSEHKRNIINHFTYVLSAKTDRTADIGPDVRGRGRGGVKALIFLLQIFWKPFISFLFFNAISQILTQYTSDYPAPRYPELRLSGH